MQGLILRSLCARFEHNASLCMLTSSSLRPWMRLWNHYQCSYLSLRSSIATHVCSSSLRPWLRCGYHLQCRFSLCAPASLYRLALAHHAPILLHLQSTTRCRLRRGRSKYLIEWPTIKSVLHSQHQYPVERSCRAQDRANFVGSWRPGTSCVLPALRPLTPTATPRFSKAKTPRRARRRKEFPIL